jgi:hypothetical protein
MDSSAERHRRRLLIALIAGGLTLILLLGVGVYGVLRGPATTAAPPAPSSTTGSVDRPGSLSAVWSPRPIPESTNADVFARAVADALFRWDTAVGFNVNEFAQPLVDAGDPSGNETAGLASDVRSYLPTTGAWTQLRTQRTRQWLTITETVVPAAWAIAETQAAPGQLVPGTTAVTVTGLRHRTGIWGTKPADTSHPVTFTVFLICEPQFDPCRLLRLSTLDNPLW